MLSTYERQLQMLIPSVKFFLGYFKQGSQPLPPTSTHSRPLPPTSTHFPPTAIYFQFFSQIPLVFRPPLPTSQFKPTPAHDQPLSLISSPLPNVLIQSNPAPTIPTHIQSLCFTFLCALGNCALMCLRVSRAHTPMLFISMHFTAQVKTIYSDCIFSKIHFSSVVSFAIPIFLFYLLIFLLSFHFFQCFHLFDVARAQTKSGSKKQIFSKFH